MTNDQTDKFLDNLVNSAKKEFIAEALESTIVNLTYGDFSKVLFIKVYGEIAKDETSISAYHAELDTLSKVFKTIMDIEGTELIDTAVTYFKDMDLVFPDFDGLQSAIKNKEDYSQFIGTDPFANWIKEGKFDLKAVKETQKLLAAVGKLLIEETLKNDQAHNKFVSDLLEEKRLSIAAETYILYQATKAIDKLKKEHGVE